MGNRGAVPGRAPSFRASSRARRLRSPGRRRRDERRSSPRKISSVPGFEAQRPSLQAQRFILGPARLIRARRGASAVLRRNSTPTVPSAPAKTRPRSASDGLLRPTSACGNTNTADDRVPASAPRAGRRPAPGRRGALRFAFSLEFLLQLSKVSSLCRSAFLGHDQGPRPPSTDLICWQLRAEVTSAPASRRAAGPGQRTFSQ
jgi:hypothetical protein